MLALFAIGCQNGKTDGDGLDPIDAQGPVPSYAELVQRYNANVQKLDQLHSAAIVEMRWRDEDGNRQFEQADGHFRYVRPGKVALTAGKIGDVMMWAGANEQRYWLFDLRDETKAYVGQIEHIGKPCSEPLPLPVQPRAVPYLMGMVPLDASLADAAPPVERYRGYYVIEPPEANLRMVLHPETALPVRIDLVNSKGESVVKGELSEYRRVKMDGMAPNAGPRMARRAVFHAIGEEAQLSLRLSDLTDGREWDEIRAESFQYDVLESAYEPAEVVVLDEGCE